MVYSLECNREAQKRHYDAVVAGGGRAGMAAHSCIS